MVLCGVGKKNGIVCCIFGITNLFADLVVDFSHAQVRGVVSTFFQNSKLCPLQNTTLNGLSDTTTLDTGSTSSKSCSPASQDGRLVDRSAKNLVSDNRFRFSYRFEPSKPGFEHFFNN